jgi:hypothetical protein
MSNDTNTKSLVNQGRGSGVRPLHCDPHVLRVVEPCLETQPRESQFVAQAHILARRPGPFKINIQLPVTSAGDIWHLSICGVRLCARWLRCPLRASAQLCTAARQMSTLDPVVRSRHTHARGNSMQETDACATNRGGHAVLVRTTRALQACVDDQLSIVDASMIGSLLSMSRVSSRASARMCDALTVEQQRRAVT